jgi:hypothetical protein
MLTLHFPFSSIVIKLEHLDASFSATVYGYVTWWFAVYRSFASVDQISPPTTYGCSSAFLFPNTVLPRPMLVLITSLSGNEASKPDSLFRIFSLLFQCPEVHEKHSSALLCAAGRKRKQCSSSNHMFSRILLRFSGSSASSDHVLPVMNHGYIEPV